MFLEEGCLPTTHEAVLPRNLVQRVSMFLCSTDLFQVLCQGEHAGQSLLCSTGDQVLAAVLITSSLLR